MFDRLPPLQTLRAFEATARLLSMTLAAEELHVTHGAVSRHIKTLENHLGVPLFRRLTRRIVLTDAGAEFHFAVARLLGELTREAESLRGHDSIASMTISTSVSFASKWLAPRLHRFKAIHPELDVHLDVTDRNVDLDDGQVDAAVRYGGGRYPRVQSERILEETVTPVCSPSYREEVGGLTNPASLTRCTLLHEDRMLANWEQWFAYADVGRSRRGRGAAYSHGSMAIEAAIRGEGVALGRSALVGDDIAAGRLVAPFPDIRLKVERGYDLVYRTGNRDHPKVRALREWLAGEVKQFLADTR
ncbi:transcriptional regulator GcvA [Paraburkholderia edwinii]|jgi:LysR family glycine cleavage system transcriptional activator|uniref:Transcriptional regulator GcvA n=1 Tax=Paraburkholderia edwinii TaxID=2861782 RepID=A0ABX8UEA9_9BURK|nr:transcriptional regulator GcvA [Paraburkholderia edwinii]QYD67050.1 transcriptional regulator GcvA [Paraburkholderia edwinii]